MGLYIFLVILLVWKSSCPFVYLEIKYSHMSEHFLWGVVLVIFIYNNNNCVVVDQFAEVAVSRSCHYASPVSL